MIGLQKSIFYRQKTNPCSYFSPLKRELTGKLSRSEVEEVRTGLCRAAVNFAKKKLLSESLEQLERAALLGCPFSNFILGYFYTNPDIRILSFARLQSGIYDLSSGMIFYNIQSIERAKFPIELECFHGLIKTDLSRAIAYLTKAYEKNNPQGAFCLAYIYYFLWQEEHADHNLKLFEEWGSKALQVFDLACKYISIADLCHIASLSTQCAKILLGNPDFIESLLENMQDDSFEYLTSILCSDLEIAKFFFTTNDYWRQINAYQKSVLIQEILINYPDCFRDLETLAMPHCTYK